MTITLDTLPNATLQQIFDQAVRHLLTQRQRAVNADGGCVYRLPGTDLKCAAGALISDEEYRPSMEGTGIIPIVREYHLPIGKLPTTDCLDLLVGLQAVHDNFGVGAWPKQLTCLAARYDLDLTVLNEFTH